MSTHNTDYSRTLLKTRWVDLDRDKTDQGLGKPMPPMQKPCPGTTVALPEPSAADTAGVSVSDAIRGRASHRKFTDAPLTLAEVLLNHHFGGAVDFVWAAVPYRCEWKYEAESLRLILLGLDGHEKFAVYAAPVGKKTE